MHNGAGTIYGGGGGRAPHDACGYRRRRAPWAARCFRFWRNATTTWRYTGPAAQPVVNGVRWVAQDLARPSATACPAGSTASSTWRSRGASASFPTALSTSSRSTPWRPRGCSTTATAPAAQLRARFHRRSHRSGPQPHQGKRSTGATEHVRDLQVRVRAFSWQQHRSVLRPFPALLLHLRPWPAGDDDARHHWSRPQRTRGAARWRERHLAQPRLRRRCRSRDRGGPGSRRGRQSM